MNPLSCSIAALLLCFLVRAYGQPPADQPAKELAPEVIKAWQEARAPLIWYHDDGFGYGVVNRTKRAQHNPIPGFELRRELTPGLIEALPVPAQPFALLIGRGATDDDLIKLAGLKTLQVLVLSGNVVWRGEVTGAGLKYLSSLENLRSLRLSGTKVTDAGLKELAGLKALQVLNLAETEITDAATKEIAAVKNLEVLCLSDVPITDEGVKELVGLKKLKALSLSHTKITDEGLKEVARIGTLERLNLSHMDLTDEGVKHLIVLKNLKELDLSFTLIDDPGFKEIAAIKSLRILDVSHTLVYRKTVETVRKARPDLRIYR